MSRPSEVVTPSLLRQWPLPSAGASKYGRGQVLVIGSAAGTPGGAGLLARGAELAQAACWGTHLHATCGDRLAARVGPLGFLARDLLNELPLVLVELSS